MSLNLVKSLLPVPARQELTERSISADELSSFEIAMDLDGALNDARQNNSDTTAFQKEMLAYSKATVELQQKMLLSMQLNTNAILTMLHDRGGAVENRSPMLYDAQPLQCSPILPMFEGGGETMNDLLATDDSPILDQALFDLDKAHEIYQQPPLADLTANSDCDPTKQDHQDDVTQKDHSPTKDQEPKKESDDDEMEKVEEPSGQAPDDIACGDVQFTDFLTAYSQLAENGQIVPSSTSSVTCSKLAAALQTLLPGNMSKTNVLKGQKMFMAHVHSNPGALAAFAVSDTHPVRTLSAGGGPKNRQYKLVGWAEATVKKSWQKS